MSRLENTTLAGSSDDVPSHLSKSPASPGRAYVSLDLGALELFGQIVWLQLVCTARRLSYDRGAAVVGVSGLHSKLAALPEHVWRRVFPGVGIEPAGSQPLPTPDTQFVFLADAARFSRKLLGSFSQLYIAPEALPGAIDPALFAALQSRPESFEELEDVLRSIDEPRSAERLQTYRATLAPSRPRATLITSVFDGDLYLSQFLDNAARLHGYADSQHLLIRAGSPGNEHHSLLSHVRRHPSAVYINLARDPGLYEVWNLGVRLANGRYLSNANLDDRRSPEHLERLCNELDNRPDIDLVSSPLRIAETPNMDWSDSGGCEVMFRKDAGRQYDASALFKVVDGRLRARSLPHCMPVWRRELHARYGFFDEAAAGASADWEFWLRAGASGARFLMLEEPLGVFLRAPTCYSRRDAAQAGQDTAIAERYRHLLEGDVHRFSGGSVPSKESLTALHAASATLELIVQLALRAASATWEDAEPTGTSAENSLMWQLTALPSTASLQPLVGIDGYRGTAFWDTIREFVVGVARQRWSIGNGTVSPEHALPLLTGLCADAFEVTGEWIWLLMHARLLGRAWDDAGERALLQYLRAQDRQWFWKTVQTIYRFDVALHSLAALAADPVQESVAADGPSEVPEEWQVWYYPDYRNNRYQALLYESFQDRGGRVCPVDDLHQLRVIEHTAGRKAVLHLHWLNAVYRNFSGIVAEHRMKFFLAVLRRLRNRGVRLYWTVHNRYSHKIESIAQERWLSRSVYGLVDRVFIHHPLALEELDWLPGTAKVALAEHGPYAVGDGNREDARRHLRVSPDERLLVHVGMVRDYKGLERYLPALRRALDRHGSLRILIAGEVSAPKARAFLEAHVHPRLDVYDRYVPDAELDCILCAADAGFLSYRSVLTSGTQFHLLCNGVPVIAPELGTLPAYIVDGWNGYCYEGEADLDHALDRLMALSRKDVERMRANAQYAGQSLEWHFQ